MKFFIPFLLHTAGAVQRFSFERACRNPEETQNAFLRHLLRENRESAFGREHGFETIQTAEDFQSRVPVRDFEAFRPWVDRIAGGETNVLTREPPILLAKTSGTTGEPKFLPITRTAQRQELGLIAQWYYRALLNHPGFLDHSRVAIVSAVVEGKTPGGLPYGSASGMIFHCIPDFIRRLYAIPPWVSDVKDYEERYFLMAAFAVSKRVSFILTPNPSTLLRFAEVIQQKREALIQAIGEGATPNPGRARFLSAVLKKTGAFRPKDIWPELKLISCWLGGSVGLQARGLASYYGSVPLRDMGYMASEGHFTLPVEDHTPAGVLALGSNYYEFIPEHLHGEALGTTRTLLASQVEKGKRYAMILTSPSGLYRYDINDIVEVTGFYQRAPVLAFVRKGGEMTNITGEKMHVNHFLAAIEEVGRQFSLPVKQFRIRADLDDTRYAFYLELSADFSEQILKQEVLPALDRKLFSLNVEYAEKRRSKRLGPPCLHLMRRGWSEEECRRFAASGKRDTQFKWRVLSSERRREDEEAVQLTLEGIEQ